MNYETAFGNWLSGFVDGEGTFYLGLKPRVGRPGFKVSCRFAIGLRDDDSEILREICHYMRCGVVRPIRSHGTSHSQVRFSIDAIEDNRRCLIPHFDRYPLRAKKARDYAIYREAVFLVIDVGLRGGLNNRSKGWWSERDIDRFRELKRRIEEERRYK